MPKLNPEIWSTLDHGTRASDLRTQKEQKQLGKTLSILSDRVMDTEDTSDLLEPLADAMALVLQTTQDLSSDRRVKILSGPTVNKKYTK